MTKKNPCEDCGSCDVCKAMERHPAGKAKGHQSSHNYFEHLKVQEIMQALSVDEDWDEDEPDSDFETNLRHVAEIGVRLLLSKHKDYGPKNISQSPGGALNGLRVRMHDKLARINHLIDTGAEPENEALIDSFMDLANYALIAQMVIRGEWPRG